MTDQVILPKMSEEMSEEVTKRELIRLNRIAIIGAIKALLHLVTDEEDFEKQAPKMCKLITYTTEALLSGLGDEMVRAFSIEECKLFLHHFSEIFDAPDIEKVRMKANLR